MVMHLPRNFLVIICSSRFRLLSVSATIVLVILLQNSVSAQTYFNHYYNFDITGQTSICPDNTTNYTYNSPYLVTWTVTGGTIVGSNYGTSVTVRWNSVSGTISATGTEQDCWYEPDIYPPTMFCNVFHYTANPFNLTNLINPYFFTGTNVYCSGSSTTLMLNGSQAGVNYQLQLNGVNTGSSLAGTGSSISWPNITAAGTYTVVASRTSPACTQTLSTSTVVSVTAPSVGGTIAGSTSACTSHSGTLTLSGHTGTIVRWEQNTGSSWTNITNTTTSFNYSNVTTTTQYRAWIVNGGCTGAYSTVATVTISPASSAGAISGGGTFCGSANGTLTLTAYTGSIIRWEYSTGGAYIIINNTSPTLSYSGVTTSTTYRAVVKSGACAEVNSSTAVVSVISPSVGGSVSGSTSACISHSGTLTLSGHTGTIDRWEQNTGSSWTNVTNTTTSLTYSNVTTTTQYRAWVVNGACSGAYSTIATITISPASAAGTISGGGVFCASGNGTLTLNTYTGSVIRWEYSTGGNFIPINHTTPTLSYSGITTTTTYRAVVKSGVCAESYSSQAQVVINPSTVPGTLASDAVVYGSSANGTLNLTAYTGNIIRWEKNAGTGWSTIAHTLASYTYNVSQTTSFRAVVRNSPCLEMISNQVTITLYNYPSPVITTSQPTSISHGQSVMLTCSAGYWSYRWFLNGNPIVGAESQHYTANEPGQYFVAVRGHSGAPEMNSSVVTVKSLISGYDQILSAVSKSIILQENVSETASLYSLETGKVSQIVSYQDGLGRQLQTVAIGQSPTGGDIITHNPYSRHGQIDSTFLPYATALRDGHYRPNAIRGSSVGGYTASEQYLFYQNTPKVAQDGHPYARTLYTNDPTFRVKEQGAPGQAWQPGTNKTILSQMTLNNSTTFRVRYWNTAGSTSGNYPANSVVVNITTDENGNKVQTYTDARGLMVLKQVQMDEPLEGIATTWLETYYIYDALGRLSIIVPPKAMRVLGTGTTLNANNASVAELIYKFTYDPRGRLVEKKVPGAAVQFIVYDKLDRVALVQDGNLRGPSATPLHRWMFLKYDIYNRPVYSGIYTNTTQTTRATVQTLLDNINYDTTPWYEVEQTGAVHGYSNNAFPSAGTIANVVLTVNYYDHYNFDRVSGDDFAYDPVHYAGQESSRSMKTRGLPTGSKQVVFDAAGNATSTWLFNIVFYDKYDRPIQILNTNHLHTAWTVSTIDKRTIIYDFVKPLKTKTSHFQSATTVIHLEDRSDYDLAGRLIKTYRKINNGPEQVLAAYEYNALGQLVDKKLHNLGGESYLQSVDFRYNIRGWLKSINNAQLIADGGATNDDTNDFFGMELIYNTAESGLGNTLYFNGNISAIKWKGIGSAATADQRSYKYIYDKSDRLKTATFQAHNGIGWTKEANTLNEAVTYDHNGNIKTLLRSRNLRGNEGINVTSQAQTIDNLTYTYASNLNRLTKVEDAVSVTAGFINGVNATTEYQYALDGSLTKDDNKGISSITYNVLGKPLVINFSNGKKVEYVYDASGNKLTMKTFQGTTLLTCTNYSGSFVYEGNTPVLSFFGSPEGRIVKNGSNFEHQYAIADHQGNTRVVFTSNAPAPASVTATMEASMNNQVAGYPPTSGFRSSLALFNRTAGGTFSQLLNGGNNGQVGVGKSYQAQAKPEQPRLRFITGVAWWRAEMAAPAAAPKPLLILLYSIKTII